MSHRLVALDLDGTLLDGTGSVPPDTVRAIRDLSASGVVFVLATGRPFPGAEKYCSLLGLSTPAIVFNGAQIVDSASRAILFSRNLLRRDAETVLAWGRRLGATMCIWSGDTLYGNKLDDKIRAYSRISGIPPRPVEDWDALLDRGIAKILWCGDPDWITRVQRELPPGDFREVTRCTSQPTFLEFFDSRVSKGAALRFVAERLGIPREEILAIGDGMNDLDMLRCAGTGVAMPHAPDALKAAARHVLPPSQGVSSALRLFFPP
ncbi:MAG: HAD family phosphatase [Kiritimatiellae bacterium]|nr:HAD family phosphatase [Kiritimatiellia bacterium]